MKVCARCKQIIQEGETYCLRCGSTQFTEANPQAQQRPQQRPQQMQGQGQMQGQRPMNQQQMQGQRPMNPQQRPPQQMQNQGQMQGQRPMNSQQRPPQQMQGQGQRPVNGFMGNQGQPQRPQPQQPYQNNQMQGYENNGYDNNEYNDYTDNDFVDNATKPAKKKINFSTTEDPNASSVKEWIITLLIMIIPIFNIVYIIKNIKNPTVNETKRNFLIAYLIYFTIALVASLSMSLLFTVVLSSLF